MADTPIARLVAVRWGPVFTNSDPVISEVFEWDMSESHDESVMIRTIRVLGQTGISLVNTENADSMWYGLAETHEETIESLGCKPGVSPELAALIESKRRTGQWKTKT